MTAILVPPIVACAAWAAIAAVVIARHLEKHGIIVDLLWWRMSMPHFLTRYRQLTLAETGQVGSLFYHFVVPLWIALAPAMLLLVAKLRG